MRDRAGFERVRLAMRALAVAAPLAASGCAGFNPDAPNLFLQPQATNGPCQVKKFFLLSQRAVHTDMAVEPSGGACVFTVVNPNLQVFPTAVLVTVPASHGLAQAGLANGGRSAIVSYQPLPGYRGPDRFTVTIEPNDNAIAVAVTVGAAGP